MCSRLRRSLEQQLPDVGAGRTRTSSTASADSTETIASAAAMLEHGGQQLAAVGRGPELVRGANNGGNAGGDVFGVEPCGELAVDEQPVASEHDRGVDSFALPDGGDQITNARHSVASRSRRKWWRS